MDRCRRQSNRLVLDLGGVKFIDEAGLWVLKKWAGKRLVLRGATLFVRALLHAQGLACSP